MALDSWRCAWNKLGVAGSVSEAIGVGVSASGSFWALEKLIAGPGHSLDLAHRLLFSSAAVGALLAPRLAFPSGSMPHTTELWVQALACIAKHVFCAGWS